MVDSDDPEYEQMYIEDYGEDVDAEDTEHPMLSDGELCVYVCVSCVCV